MTHKSIGLGQSIKNHPKVTFRKCNHIEIKTRFNLIHEKEWTGDTISIICKRYGVSRKTYYKWNKRY
ncbi:MAG: helix-turn-helix domain-containing protein, partial [Nitrososphaeraceae archaeon]